MPEATLVAVFLAGLLGGGHCAAMCGGIVGALSAQRGARFSFHLAYNAGRVGRYAVHARAAVAATSYGAPHFGLPAAGLWRGWSRERDWIRRADPPRRTLPALSYSTTPRCRYL